MTRQRPPKRVRKGSPRTLLLLLASGLGGALGLGLLRHDCGKVWVLVSGRNVSIEVQPMFARLN